MNHMKMNPITNHSLFCQMPALSSSSMMVPWHWALPTSFEDKELGT